ncbi:unnamed protein product [Pleuronectes platessa]|uniref:Uncharacterized protein n=1 Tax=Pleuronectes platessa TaxID=8262 RepID=A0A9N7YLX7_PLEPL|nr:unnamed protein product [Pleuronectes platessa]
MWADPAADLRIQRNCNTTQSSNWRRCGEASTHSVLFWPKHEPLWPSDGAAASLMDLETLARVGTWNQTLCISNPSFRALGLVSHTPEVRPPRGGLVSPAGTACWGTPYLHGKPFITVCSGLLSPSGHVAGRQSCTLAIATRLSSGGAQLVVRYLDIGMFASPPHTGVFRSPSPRLHLLTAFPSVTPPSPGGDGGRDSGVINGFSPPPFTHFAHLQLITCSLVTGRGQSSCRIWSFLRSRSCLKVPDHRQEVVTKADQRTSGLPVSCWIFSLRASRGLRFTNSCNSVSPRSSESDEFDLVCWPSGSSGT